jgi:hypothetical protein
MVKCSICKKDAPEEKVKEIKGLYSTNEGVVVCEDCIKRLEEEYLPNECVLLKDCEVLLSQEYFESYCLSRKWIYCEKAKEQAKKYYRKPVEWVIILFHSKMPKDMLKPKVEEKKPEPEKPEKKRRFFS